MRGDVLSSLDVRVRDDDDADDDDDDDDDDVDDDDDDDVWVSSYPQSGKGAWRTLRAFDGELAAATGAASVDCPDGPRVYTIWYEQMKRCDTCELRAVCDFLNVSCSAVALRAASRATA